MPSIETCLSPAIFDQFDVKGKCVVMIDVLRASSTIVSALDAGLSSVIPFANLEEARAMKNKGYTIAAERQGKAVEGFDLGNSPIKIRTAGLTGKDLVLTTTNGTRCIEMAKEADMIIVAGVLNNVYAAEFLTDLGKDILLFCAAWKDRVNWEDSYGAGGLCKKLMAHGFDLADDASGMVLSIYERDKLNLQERLKEAVHFKRLSNFGVEDDIHYCFSTEEMRVVPNYRDGKLVPAQF